MSEAPATATLLVWCPDRRGLVAALATLLADHGANILQAQQHRESQTETFFQRIHFDMAELDIGRDALEDRLDVSRTVGWFTTVFPVTFELAEQTADAAVRSARAALQALPMRGAAYGMLRYLHPESGTRRSLAERTESEILFNYLGPVDDLVPPDDGAL